MRIQHNIMAMNAYRNYNNNNKALSGNLEKLSSGYKINRAGDDAAGLAISEKMRAQITGLNAASKNVKDGISLVKTAEGAMQEIQDMLNRMDYLATQSANGTYQDEVDREALQKEVNQLKDEINRIADSANFNGIKLLDGTWDVDGKAKAVDAAQAALDAAKKGLEDAKAGIKADPVYGEPMSTDEVKDIMLTLGGDGPNGAADVGTKTVLETEKVEYQRPSFQVNLNGVKHTMTTASVDATTGVAEGGAGAVTVTVNGVGMAITEDDIAKYLQDRKLADDEDIKPGLEVDSETLAAIFADKMKSSTFNDGTYEWDVRADGESLVFEFSSNNTTPTQTLNKHYDTSITRLSGTTVDATGGKFTSGAYTAGVATGGAASVADTQISVTAKIGGKNVTFTGTAGAAVTAAGLATAVGNATATIDGKTVKLSDYFNVADEGNDGTVDIESIATGKEGSDSIEKFTLTLGAPATTNGGTAAQYTNVTKKEGWTEGTDAYTPGTSGYINAGTEVTIAGVPSASEQLASTTLDFSDLDIVDGMKVKLGDTEYTFAVGADSKFKDAENVVDLTGMDAEKLQTTANGGTQADRSLALSKLVEAAKDNEIFTVSHEIDTGAGTGTPKDQIGLKQKAEVKDTTDMTTMDKFAGYISITTVDEKATEAAQKELDAKQPELIAKAEKEVKDAQAALDDANAGDAKALNLQIGDTSDSFNQLGVKIGSMKTDALKITDLSIGTADDAAAAIDTIKDAINYVSSVRGDLGAYQNRLDHTANNLSVMAENIQDAESTIRDTDVAEEMMSYVKNNILVQSAQAMLAQANQVPQGVLQLLG